MARKIKDPELGYKDRMCKKHINKEYSSNVIPADAGICF